MERRQFLEVTAAALGTTAKALADAPMPTTTLGKSGLKVSRITLGGHHMAVNGEAVAEKVILRAVDLGILMFDSAHIYNKGKSDEIYGNVLGSKPSLRQKVLLMSKAEKRSKAAAMQQLEETLRRMKTDYLDLWQCHQVSEHSEVDQIFGPDGALEAFVQAKQQGKVRHIGFTGHRDPAVHLRMLEGYDGWETVQHPVNLIDPHYLSFVTNLIPKTRAKGLGTLAIKSNAIGQITKQGVAKIEECLRFALSNDIDTVVSGMETVEQLEQNVAVVKTFRKMTPAEISSLLDRTAHGPIGSAVEKYKRPEAKAAVIRALHSDGE